MAALLVSAVLASAAPANIISYDEYPADGEGLLSGGISMTVSNTSITCTGGTAFGVWAQRPSDALTPEGMTNPTGCVRTINGTKVNTEIKLNGCQLRVHAPPSNQVDVYPPNCGPVEIIEGAYCTRYVDPQSGISNSAGITNEKINGRDGLNIGVNVAIPYRIKSKGTFCQEGSLTWNSTWQMGATGNGGLGIGVRVEPPVGMFMSGSGFDFESSPSYVSGQQDAADPHTLSFQNRAFQCDYANWEAGSTAATKNLSLTAAYEYCDAVVLGNTRPAVIKMNSCSYNLQALNASPPYSGSLGISCSKEGDGIEAKVYTDAAALKADTPMCAYKVAPQSGLGSIGLSNIGEGSGRQVATDLSLTGVAYTRTTGTLANCGSASANASYSGTSNLHGLQ